MASCSWESVLTTKCIKVCGPYRTRTDYLFDAIEALYQVS